MNRKLRNKIFIAGAILIGFAVALKISLSGEKTIDSTPEPQVKKVEYNPVSEIENTLQQFDTFLIANLKEAGTVGAAAIITYKGKIVYSKCYGTRKAGDKIPVDTNTIFRLASVSKSLTGVLAGILHDEKQINLDDKVVKYLPDFKLKDSVSTAEIKVKHLLSHTTGLIPHAYDLMVEDQVPLKTIMSKLNEVDISGQPGELYSYQNVIYSIYDPLFQKQSGKSFSELMQKKVFVPFGMNNASTGFEAFKKSENKAFPHVNKGNNKYVPVKLNNRYYNTLPAAGVNASISDLGNFLAVLSNSKTKILPKKIRETIFLPQIETPLKQTYFRSWGETGTKQYAIGWRIVNYKNREVAYHGGFVSGYKAEIAVCPEEEIGIAILSNSPNQITAQNIPVFLNLVFDKKEKLAQQQNTNSTAGNES